MSTLALLSRLKQSGISIRLEKDNLKINAPKGKLTPGLVNELKTRKEEIIQFLQSVQTQTDYVSIEPIEKKQYYSLSSAQKRLYFLQQFEYKSTFYNMPYIIPLGNQLNREKLENTFKQLISRHESLRTSFHMVNDEPAQRIHDEVEFAIEYYNLGKQGNRERGNKKNPLSLSPSLPELFKNFIRPFDLSQAPLIRVGVIPPDPGPVILLVDMHHIISDGASEDILAGDFMELYREIHLPPLRIQYKDYAEWQNSQQQQELMKQQQTYWKNLLCDELPVLHLPYDFPRPPMQSFEGNTLHFELDETETKNVKQLSQNLEVTLYMTVLSIFNILLSKLSNQEDIIIGTPVAGRLHPDLESIIGMFVNTLPMRNSPQGHKTLKTFLKEVKEQTLKAYENQAYQFDELVEQLEVRRDTSRNPVFDVMCNFLEEGENPQGTLTVEEQSQNLSTYRNPTAKFDLILTAMDRGEKMVFELEYCIRLFEENTIRRMTRYFKKIARLLPADGNMMLADIETITPEEKNQLLLEFNDTETQFPLHKTIHQLFAEQVENTPQQVALVFADQQVTYAELNKKANQLAGSLRDRGIKPDDIVCIMIERSIELIVGILGILKAGGCFLPVEAKYPTERKIYMLKDSAVQLLLTNHNKEDREELTAILGPGAGLEIIDVNDPQLYSGESANLPHINHPGDLMYLIYTSGSTGQPKGVMLEHRNIVNLMLYCLEYTNLDFSVVLQFSTISFDASIHEIFTTLLCGGKLCLIHKDIQTNLLGLFNVIASNQVKTVFLPISLLKAIFNEEDYAGMFPGCVDHIQTAGEQVVVSDRFRTHLQEKNKWLHNHYGPAEAHVVTVFAMDPAGEIPELPPIGKPIANTFIYILGRSGKLQPLGVAGELYIGGVQVGRGYLDRPELTAEKFIQPQIYTDLHRFTQESHLPHSLIYCTGDLSRWLSDGNIEFLGRIDHQVKIRGFRIEPGEIETQLLNHQDIQEAVVLPKQDARGEKYLCAYVVGTWASGKDLDVAKLKTYLEEKLADFMVPAYFVQMEHIPINPHGKVDRKALPEPEITIDSEYTPPENHLQEKLVEIWAEVLGHQKETIGINANFFQVGGQSLKATIMAAKIHKSLNVVLPLAQIFKTPTIKALSQFISGLMEEKYISIKPVEKKEYYSLSSIQKRLYIVQCMESSSTAYNLPGVIPLGDIDKNRLEQAFRKLIRRHETLRTSFEMINDEPVQRIHNEVEFAINFYDSGKQGDRETGVLGEDSDRQANKEIGNELSTKTPVSLSPSLPELSKDFIQPFDLSRAPLLHATLIKTGNSRHLLMTDIHHIISDAASVDILAKEFTAFYSGRDLPPLKLQFKDYVQWQNSPQIQAVIKQQEKYWINEFTGQIPVLDMSIDFERPPVQSFQGSAFYFTIGKEETQRIKELALEENATSYMVMFAVYNVLLSKLSGQEEIIIGMVIAARRHPDLQNIIGMFVNTLALRNFPQKEKTFRTFLKEVREKMLLAFENQDFPLEDLVEKVAPTSDRSRNPLFDTVFNSSNTHMAPVEDSGSQPTGTTAKQQEYDTKTTKFDIAFFSGEVGDELHFSMDYSTKLFKKETIERFSGYFREIVSQIIDNNDIQLKDINISHRLLTAKSIQPEMELGF